MKLKLIYPQWPKLPNQPRFNLPPMGPVSFAAALPADVDVDFCDENVEALDLQSPLPVMATQPTDSP